MSELVRVMEAREGDARRDLQDLRSQQTSICQIPDGSAATFSPGAAAIPAPWVLGRGKARWILQESVPLHPTQSAQPGECTPSSGWLGPQTAELGCSIGPCT